MLEVNKIYNADCLELMKQLPDKCIDLVLTDPPYGIGAGDIKFANGATANLNKYNIYKNNDWDVLPKKEVFDEIFRISKNQIIWGANYFVEFLQNSQCWFFWDKGTGDNSYADGELAYTSFKMPVKKFYKSWIGQNAKDTVERLHPTQKSVKLFEWCLKQSEKYLKEDSIILDCFSGSGTTAIACHNLNRDFICIEKDYDYWKASVERLENAQAQCKLF